MIGEALLLAAQVGPASFPAPAIVARPIPPSKPWYDSLSLSQCAVVDPKGNRIGFTLTVANRKGKTTASISGGKQLGLQTNGFVDASNVRETNKRTLTLRTIRFVSGDNEILVRQLFSGKVFEKTSFSASHKHLKSESLDFEYLSGFCFDYPSAPEVKQ